MQQISVFRTKQGLEFQDPRQAQLAEDILDVIDGFFARQAEHPATVKYSEIEPPDEPNDDDIATIKLQMAAQDLSGRALARKAGISPGTISAVLTRKAPLSADIRQRITRALLQE